MISRRLAASVSRVCLATALVAPAALAAPKGKDAAPKAKPEKAKPDKAKPDKAKPDKAKPDKAKGADKGAEPDKGEKPAESAQPAKGADKGAEPRKGGRALSDSDTGREPIEDSEPAAAEPSEPPTTAVAATTSDATTTDATTTDATTTDATRDAAAADAGHEWLSERGSSVLELRADLGAFSRQFAYHQDVNDQLRDHDVGFAPLIGARLAWYPGAHFTSDSVANLGIVAGYERSIFANSSSETGDDFDTTMQAYTIGARLRFPIASHEIGISGVYGRHEFKVDAGREPNAVAANGLAVDRDYVPDVAYSYVRPGLDARFAFGRIHAGLGFGYRAIHEIGELHGAEWFPQATVHGIDGFLTVGFEIKPRLIVFGGADFARYALSMNSSIQDLAVARDVAGGAIDQSIAGRAGIEWRLEAPASAREGAANARGKRWAGGSTATVE